MGVAWGGWMWVGMCTSTNRFKGESKMVAASASTSKVENFEVVPASTSVPRENPNRCLPSGRCFKLSK